MFAHAAEAIENARDPTLAAAAERLGAAVVEELQTRARDKPAMAGLFASLEEGVESSVSERAVVGLRAVSGNSHSVERLIEFEMGKGDGVTAPILAPIAAQHAEDIVGGMRERLLEIMADKLSSREA
jgi:2-oxo-4-hydroxy-4-carboxy--5-ureidoimidazoline (OHCU) decarboxylase